MLRRPSEPHWISDSLRKFHEMFVFFQFIHRVDIVVDEKKTRVAVAQVQ